MTALSGETAVFRSTPEVRCAVVFLVKRHSGISTTDRETAGRKVADVLHEFARQGWLLSARVMFGSADPRPWAYDSGFAHYVDAVGVFEAPNAAEALRGVDALEAAGWSRLCATEWLLGPREFAPVPSTPSRTMERAWGFVALWRWNDAWQAATPAERAEYDAECDVAFQSDLSAGIDIAGRHRLDWASSWHHLGIWEADDLRTIDAAMREHERVADFKFTTSRHFIGRRRPLLSLLGVSDA